MWASPDIHFSAIRNILIFRYGVLWNKKIAYMFRSPYLIGLDSRPPRNSNCPLCHEPDSGGHSVPPGHEPTGIPTEDELEKVGRSNIEVVFCSDTQYAEKLQEKLAQHVQLIRELYATGWKHVELHILTFGVGGTTYTHNLKALLDLGVSPTEARKCLMNIHTASVLRGHQMVTTRRWKERELTLGRRTCAADTEGD